MTPDQLSRDWEELEFLVAFLGRAAHPDAVSFADEVEPEWFLVREARTVWTAMRELSRSAMEVDAFSIKRAMKDAGARKSDFDFLANDVFGHPALHEPPSSLRARVKAIRAAYLRRRLARLGATLQGDTGDLPSLLGEARAVLGDIECDGADAQVISYGDILATAKNGGAVLPLHRRVNSLQFGIPGLDHDLCAGPGTFGILAAKTSAGKSALAIQCALESAKKGLHPLMVNLEMDREDVGSRLVAGMTGRDSFDILRKESPAITPSYEEEKAVERIRGIHAASGEPWKKLEGAIRKAHRHAPLDLVIVDYFTLLDPPASSNRNASVAYQLGDLSKAMKRLASQLGICILALSQFNRGIEDGKEPSLENLRETGQLEQDASFVLLMWTERAKYEPGEDRTVKIRVAKNRGGKRWGLHHTLYKPAFNIFHETIAETKPQASWLASAACDRGGYRG